MDVRFGWDMESSFGQFVAVASAVLGVALLALSIGSLLVVRYEARVADGAINPPALRTLHDGAPVYVVGANIGDVPDDSRIDILGRVLKQEVKGLPWGRALIRRRPVAGPLATHSLFFPVNGIAEAFALCAKLAGIPPDCAPAIVSTTELSGVDGVPVSRDMLGRIGIVPYAPPRGRTRVASMTAPPPTPHAIVQPPLVLQHGVPSEGAFDAPELFWLSSDYPPGNTKLVDVVAAGDIMMGSIGMGLNPQLRADTDPARLIGARLASIFRHADIAFANLEGPLYDGPEASPKDCANCYAFHSPPSYAGVLARLGLDVVSLANNHSGDYGAAGRDSTMAALRKHGIAYGGLDRNGARAASLVLPGGRTAAVTAFAPNSGTLSLNDIPAAQALIERLRKNT